LSRSVLKPGQPDPNYSADSVCQPTRPEPQIYTATPTEGDSG